MSKRVPQHLYDALTAARRAGEFLGELDLGAYRANALVCSAVERQLGILGEAGKRAVREEPELGARMPI